MPRDARNVPVTVADGKRLSPRPRCQKGTVVSNGNGHGHAAMEVEVVLPTSIVKRDGRVVPFDVERIENALTRCFAAFDREPHTPSHELARRVVNIIAAKASGETPTVEGVQDIVEMVLQAAGEFEAAKRVHPVPRRARQAARGAPDPGRGARRRSPHPTSTSRRRSRSSSSSTSTPASTTSWAGARPGSRPSIAPVDFLHELAGDAPPRRDLRSASARGILEMRVDAVDAPAGDGRRGRAAQQHRHLQLLATSRSRASTRSARR